jgi:hypothetical protein
MDESARSFTSVWCDSKSQRDATLSLFFFPFCLSLMCGYPFFKKKSSRFFVVGYAKKKKTIEVKVWVVSS